MSVRKYLSDHPDTPVEQLAAGLLYGIEIEFSDAGDLGSYKADCPYDESDAEASLEEDREETLIAAFQGHGSRVTVQSILRNTSNSLEDLVNDLTPSSWSTMVADELNRMQENWEPESRGFIEVDGWDNSEDGTDGIVQEYRTSQPGSLDDTFRKVQHLMDNANDCTVPLNGSCHIHVSFPGCHHKVGYDSQLHCCILWELSQRVSAFPERLMSRIQSRHAHYFNLSENPCQKFTAIHCHPQGSWEFRLFGAMTDEDDIGLCLRIAGESLVRGYQRYLSHQFDVQDIPRFRQEFALTIAREESLPELAIRDFRSYHIGKSLTGYGFDSPADHAVSTGFTTWLEHEALVAATELVLATADF